MGLFDFNKKKIVNFTEELDNQWPFSQERNTENQKSEQDEIDLSIKSVETPDEKRKKLAKRLSDIIEKLDSLNTQIYHLQQRVEVLEKKIKL